MENNATMTLYVIKVAKNIMEIDEEYNETSSFNFTLPGNGL